MDNNYHLPSNLGTGRKEEAESQLAGELTVRHSILDITQSYNTGSDTQVLVSGSNGFGRYDRHSAIEHLSAGYKLASELGKLGCVGAEIVQDATSRDLQTAIQDTDIANIFLLGHGSLHSWVATDGAIEWFKAGKMVKDHLKNGVFANLGCGAVNSWNFIPLGRFVVGSKGLLLGKSKELTSVHEMSDLTRFKVLR